MTLSQPQAADEIELHVLQDIFPHWLSEPGDILGSQVRAMAVVWALIQRVDQTHHDRTFIERATGSYLDEHGKERNKIRKLGESDEDFRTRIRTIDDRLTKPVIVAAVNAELVTGTCTLTDHPVDDPSFVPPAGTTFYALGILGRSNSLPDGSELMSSRAYTIEIPDQAPVNRDTAFTAQDGQLNGITRVFTWEQNEAGAGPNPGMYTADQDLPASSAIYSRIQQILDDLTAAGVQARAVVV